MLQNSATNPNRKPFLTYGFLIILGLLLLPMPAFAQGMILNFLWDVVNGIFGAAVYFGGQILNIGINSFVFGFGDFYTQRGLGHVVDQMWAIIRDIFNLAFIFGLVLIGLKMIFNSSDNDAKKALGLLVIAALLINFSLFFGKTIIDFTNLAAYQIATGAFPLDPSGKANVSGVFMNLTGLQGAWNFTGSDLPSGMGFTYIIFTMILYIIMAFVFFAGGILLLIRFVVLNIYLIFSPVMFLGFVIPSAQKLTQDFWKGFMSRAFFAPAYLLMLYFSVRVVTGFSVTAGGMGVQKASLAEVFTRPGAAGFETMIAIFGLISIFLIASIVVAKMMGDLVGSKTIGAGKWVARKTKYGMGAAAAGSLAFAGRQTAGRLGKNLTKENSFLGKRLRMSAQKGGVTGALAKGTLITADKASKQSFDARNVAGLGTKLGVGESKGGGFADRREAQDKKISERGKERAKLYGYDKKAYADYGAEKEYEEYQQKIKARDQKFHEMINAQTKERRDELTKEISELDGEIKKMEKPPAKLPDDAKQDVKDKHARLLLFSNAHAAAKANYGQRVYASELANKYSNDGPGEKTRLRRYYNNFMKYANPLSTSTAVLQAAAETMNKQAGARPQEKILEELLEAQAARNSAGSTDKTPPSPTSAPADASTGPSIILDGSGRPFNR